LEHLASVGSTANWQKKAKEYEAELCITNEQVYAQYETSFQNVVDQVVYFYRCPTDRFDVHLGVVDEKLERVYEALDEMTIPAPTFAPPATDS